MCHGKVKEALDLLSNKNKGRPLHLDDTILTSDEGRQKSVRVILKEKHPQGQPAQLDSVVDGNPTTVHPVVFDALDD